MEIRAVDRYKNSPAFNAFMHREFRNAMKEYQTFLQPLVDKKLSKSRKTWRAHCRKKRIPILDMHLKIPS
ncbi:hypothetical protein ACOSQ2_003508 [Xanthoceras sorbifolium]